MTSIPRPATSVATRTSALPDLSWDKADSLKKERYVVSCCSGRSPLVMDRVPLLLRLATVQSDGVESQLVESLCQNIHTLLLIDENNNRRIVNTRVEDLEQTVP